MTTTTELRVKLCKIDK